MDGCSATQEMVAGGGVAGTPVACRWNPTKEQISMLETLYGQGLRTPTAEQIQEITRRLQTYGHIEGKNVFYWFQNHKARQRQKEKQDHLSLFRQYNHHHHHHHHRLCHQPFLPLPPSPNVLYDTCYMPPSNLGFYTQHPQVASPSISKKRPPRATKSKSPGNGGFMLKHRPESFVSVSGGNINTMNIEQNEINHCKNHSYQETLDLFPLHPTGILQERMETSATATCLASTACTSSSSGSAVDRLYFDFFA
ncbi:unnamed protein product [Lactuca saligna]|uniref:Homeobox domain-containing protein n=1 Tax=Lactuca saligna TaxID=75948 RepID=A0AA35ZT92_LACSI|nr:unnamed protein product [Lactuca saligna]